MQCSVKNLSEDIIAPYFSERMSDVTWCAVCMCRGQGTVLGHPVHCTGV